MAIRNVSSQQMPQIRARSRAMQVNAPVSSPVNDDMSNAQLLTEKLTPLLREYAQANALKNKGTRLEKKAKDALNKAMVEEGETHFSAKVEVEDEMLQFDASIAEYEAEEIDPAKVFDLVGKDIGKFLALVSVTKKAVEDTLGKNAVIMVTNKVTKPAALSVTRAK